MPGNITVNGTDTALLSIPPNVRLSDSDMMQQSSPLDGTLDEEFLAIDISHPGGPMIIVNLLKADQTFGDQFGTEFGFDELLEELVDGKYDTGDKAMQGIRNLISIAYPGAYQDETPKPNAAPYPASIETGELDTVVMTIFAVHDHADIAHFTLYMNLHGQDTDYRDSDTYVTYDMGSIRIVDPHDLIADAAVTIKTNEADLLRRIVVFVITFEDEMEQTNLVARTWNTGASLTMVRILNAFAVSAAAALPDPQPVPSGDPMPDSVMGEPEDAGAAVTIPDQNAVEMTIRVWSGFEFGSVTDAQLLDALDLEHDGDIPVWVMTELGVLCSQGYITVEEFTTAISYVLASI